VRAVVKDATLRVIAGVDELQSFSGGQDFGAQVSEPSQICFCNKAGAIILPDEFFNGALTIAGTLRPRAGRTSIVE